MFDLSNIDFIGARAKYTFNVRYACTELEIVRKIFETNGMTYRERVCLVRESVCSLAPSD